MLKDHYEPFFLILISVPPSSSEFDCITVKTILEKRWQIEFAFDSILSFSNHELTGLLGFYQLLLNHQLKKLSQYLKLFRVRFYIGLQETICLLVR